MIHTPSFLEVGGSIPTPIIVVVLKKNDNLWFKKSLYQILCFSSSLLFANFIFEKMLQPDFKINCDYEENFV